MANHPKVSVILTSYNHAKYLRESIDSVLNQTYTDFDFIIWDDGSADESWEIIKSYSDPRIRAFRGKISQRGSPIRAAVSEIDTGSYIAIHHSDDVWESQKLEKQVAFLDENPQIGAVFTRVHTIGENGGSFEDKSHVYSKIFNQPNRSRYEWLNHFFKNGNALCHPSLLIRKECYETCGTYRYGLSLLADLDMWVRLCLKYDIHIIPEKLTRFRVRSGRMNSSTGGAEMLARRPFEYLQVLDNYRNISTYEELVKVFPEAEQYRKAEGFDAGFVLGMVALGARTDKFSKLFGLTLLFESMNDPDRAEKIRSLYDFGHAEFVALNAQHDVFSSALIAGLPTQAKPPTKHSVHVDIMEGSKAGSIQKETANNKAWNLMIVLRELRSRLLPPRKP